MSANPAATRPDAKGPRRPSTALWGIPALLIPLATGLLLSWHSLGDLDIWFHLRAGRDLMAGQGIISENQYSFTEPDHPWVNHEWMFQALTTLAGPAEPGSGAAGHQPEVSGWNMMRSFLTLLLIGLLLVGDGGWNRLRGKDGAAAAAWAGIPVMAGLMLIWPRLTIRPELFSYLFFVALIRTVELIFRGLRTNSPSTGDSPSAATLRWLDCLDPRHPAGRVVLLTILWAQFHGFASLVPLVLFLAWLTAPLQSRLRPFGPPGPSGDRTWKGLLLIGLSLIALAMTPNGLTGLLMPIRALGQFSQNQVDLQATVSELVPLQDSPNSLGLTITAYRISLVWGVIWIVGTFGRVSLVRILVFALAAFAAWSSQRSIGFYGITFILLHTGAGALPWRFNLPGRLAAPRPILTAAVGLGLTLTAGGFLWPGIVSDDFYLREGVGRRFGAGLTPAHYPFQAASALAAQKNPAVFANLDAAAFLLANTTARPYIDGRTEAYSADLWAEYHDIKKADDQALRILAQRRVQSVCLATGSGAFGPLAKQLLVSDSWRLTHAEGAGLLFRPGVPAGDSPTILEQAALKTLSQAEGTSATRSADLCLAAGQLFDFAGNNPQREAAYRKGLTFKSNHPTLNHNLGNLLLNQGKFQEALPFFQIALGMNSRLVGSALNAGVCQMRLGNPAAAVASFRRAAGLDPGRFEAWVNLSSAHLASGNRPEAVAALKRALEIRPRDQRLLQRLREIRGK